MASRKNAGDKSNEGTRPSPLQRLLEGAGIPMPHDSASVDLTLFTAEERRELTRGNAEQCEANR